MTQATQRPPSLQTGPSIHETLTAAQSDSRMTSISSLPTELLSYIFETGLELSSEIYDRQWFTKTVILVSREWRDTALATSLLWTTITEAEVFRGWLDRSGDRSLDLFINMAVLDGNEAEQIMDIILPHSQRWRCIYLFDPCSVILVEDFTNSPVPRLECARIRIGRMAHLRTLREQHIWKPFLLGSRHTPDLTELRLSGTPIESCSWPLAAVTTFHFRVNGDWQDIPDLRSFGEDLARFDSLTTLVLEGAVVHVENPFASDSECVINLPFLTTLAVIACRPELFGRVPLLQILNAPLLQTLAIHMHVNDNDKWHFHLDLIGCVSSKFKLLRTLHLQCSLPIPSLHTWSAQSHASSLPTITSLALRSCVISSISQDTVDEAALSSRLRWPELRTLTIGAVHSEAPESWKVDTTASVVKDIVTLVRFLRRGCPLETLRVPAQLVGWDSFRLPVYTTDLFGRELRAAGVDVRVECIDSHEVHTQYEQWLPRDFKDWPK